MRWSAFAAGLFAGFLSIVIERVKRRRERVLALKAFDDRVVRVVAARLHAESPQPANLWPTSWRPGSLAHDGESLVWVLGGVSYPQPLGELLSVAPRALSRRERHITVGNCVAASVLTTRGDFAIAVAPADAAAFPELFAGAAAPTT